MTELTDNIIQLVCVFACGVYSVCAAVRNKSRLSILVSLFYLSFGIGITYWVLYIALFNSSPRVFFVSELSWTASYIFLAMRLAYDMPEEEHRCAMKPVFYLPLIFSFVMCIFFLHRGSYPENIMMGTAMAACGFFAVKGMYFAKRKNQPGRQWFCRAVLFFYAAEYLLWTSSYFWIDDTFFNPYFLTDTFVLNTALVLIAAAQHKEDKICHTT